jgi:hypothetical protein
MRAMGMMVPQSQEVDRGYEKNGGKSKPAASR